MDKNSIICRIAQELARVANCQKALSNGQDHHRANLEDAHDKLAQLQALLPSGSGFDAGTKIDLDRSTPEKIVLTTSFHHMDGGGCYSGWTEHPVVVRPSFVFGLDIRVGGRDRNDIKGYIAETMYHTLTQPAGI